VFEAYVEPGDIVIHPNPTFAMYSVYCQIYGARAVTLDYQPSANGPFLEAEGVIRIIRDASAKLVCLPCPDSPTGSVFSPDKLRAIIEAAGEAGSLILIDEAYYPFYEKTVLPWVQQYEHLMVTRSTGKAWGIAGFRIGFAAAGPEVAGTLHKVRAMYETSTIAMAMFDRLLDHEDAVRASVQRLLEGKAVFLEAMDEMGFRTLRNHGNFTHVAFGEMAPDIHAALSEVAYYRQDFAQDCLKGFSRFSVAPKELFSPIIASIQEVIQ
jgi:histidinol-phosphate aminotransferase